jgi:hypothetical protein
MAQVEPVTSINRVINDRVESMSENNTEADRSSKGRRPRRSYNCGPCKKQKIKCDTHIPCGACSRHNRIDQCLASPPNPPSPDHKKRVRKQSLSSFGEITASRRASIPSTTTPLQPSSSSTSVAMIPPSVPSDMRLPSLQNYTTTFKVSDNLPPLSKPWEPPSFALGPTSANRDEEVTEIKSQMALLTDRLSYLEAQVTHNVSLRNDHTHSFQEGLQTLPKPDILIRMAQFFKMRLNRPLEIIDDKSVDSRLESLKAYGAKSVPNNNDWESLSLISMIASLAVLHYPVSVVETELKMTQDGVVSYANSLLQVSKNALNTVRYKESPKLIHAQILLLYDISLRLFNKKNLIIAMGSELVSMAYVLGLQTLKIPQNSLELEAPQRIWWIICHNDTLNSLKFGIPTLIRLDSLPKDPVGSSHILKAFISAERTEHHSIITHIAKLTMICNEIPPSMGTSMAEYLENLIMVDRQLTSYQIPQAFSFLNPRNDIFMNFQCCYLNFFLVINRFRIYHRIYFCNPNNGIWFIMLSIIESFLKKYIELRKLYPPREYLNHYLQISEYPIIGTIINLVILATEPELLPQGLRYIIVNYSRTILEDLELFRNSIFNEKIPFYKEAFCTISKLAMYMQQKTTSVNPDQLTRQMELTKELKESRVFESLESNVGLIPTNDFFNIYFSSIAHHSRNMKVAQHSWRLEGVLDDEQMEFLSYLGI